MGNTVSAHICQLKVFNVFRPYPVILYRLRLVPSIHWWKKIGVPRQLKVFNVILYRPNLVEKNWCRTRW